MLLFIRHLLFIPVLFILIHTNMGVICFVSCNFCTDVLEKEVGYTVLPELCFALSIGVYFLNIIITYLQIIQTLPRQKESD